MKELTFSDIKNIILEYAKQKERKVENFSATILFKSGKKTLIQITSFCDPLIKSFVYDWKFAYNSWEEFVSDLEKHLEKIQNCILDSYIVFGGKILKIDKDELILKNELGYFKVCNSNIQNPECVGREELVFVYHKSEPNIKTYKLEENEVIVELL